MRECKSCVHYVNSKCCSWECRYETLYTAECRCYDEFADELLKIIHSGNKITPFIIETVANKLKGVDLME